MDNQFRAMIALGTASSVGVMLIFLACALPAFNNWSPLFVVFFYITAPIPVTLTQKVGSDVFGDSQGPIEMGVFASTSLMLAAFGLPMILCHASIISLGALLMTLIGNLFVYGSMVAYAIVFMEESDW
eukprot:CFRG7171T1